MRSRAARCLACGERDEHVRFAKAAGRQAPPAEREHTAATPEARPAPIPPSSPPGARRPGLDTLPPPAAAVTVETLLGDLLAGVDAAREPPRQLEERLGRVPVSERELEQARPLLLELAARLPADRLSALACGLALARMRASGPEQGMKDLLESLVRPLALRLEPHELGAVVHGLARACGQLGIEAVGTADGAPAAALDCLDREVQAARRRLGQERHAVVACGLARARALFEAPPPPSGSPAVKDPPRAAATPGRSPTRQALSSTRALVGVMARDPGAVLRAQDMPVPQRLRLLDAALRLPGGLPTQAHLTDLIERILGTPDRRLHAAALTIALQHGRHHLAAGGLRGAALGDETVESMARCALLGAAWDCADAFQRAIDEVEAGLRQELGEPGASPPSPLIETKAGPARQCAGDAIWEDGDNPSVRARWDAVLQQRHDAALARAAQRVLAFHALFDRGGFAAAAAGLGPVPGPNAEAQWCSAMEQVAWLQEQARHGSAKAQGVDIQPAWLGREARQGGPHIGMVAMEAARRLLAVLPDQPGARIPFGRSL